MNFSKLVWISGSAFLLGVILLNKGASEELIASKNQCADAVAIFNNVPYQNTYDTTSIAVIELAIDRIDSLNPILKVDLSEQNGSSERSFLKGDILPLTGSKVPFLQNIVDIGGSDCQRRSKILPDGGVKVGHCGGGISRSRAA